ncbi:hypothetical protein TIFTF001_003440 [Ficus carica]|uniref:Uncharacterized protein n=1 Tax=Ficus carica TaxID=3494 RepID=A0AA87ZRQ7_FICCA|nr:hypothetical protein TIFTF001_003440 [Ficus carica]
MQDRTHSREPRSAAAGLRVNHHGGLHNESDSRLVMGRDNFHGGYGFMPW